MDERFLALLDELRRRHGGPVVLYDAYRSWPTNTAIGGAKKSQHPEGLAADLKTPIPLSWMIHQGLFSGIGYGRHTHRVTHVDARHLHPRTNWTKGTPARPTIFIDGN